MADRKGQRIKDDQILQLMLIGTPQNVIAQRLGVTPNTICKRVNSAEFIAKLQGQRKRILDATVTGLIDNSREAVRVLGELLHSENDFVRFNAASKILSLALDYSLEADLANEVEEIKMRQREMMEASNSATIDYD